MACLGSSGSQRAIAPRLLKKSIKDTRIMNNIFIDKFSLKAKYQIYILIFDIFQ
jgi:hypothetical protein